MSPTTTHLFFLLRSFNFYTFSNPILPTFFNPVLPLQQIQNSHFSRFPLLQYPWFINSKRNQGFLIVVTYYDSLFFLLRSHKFYTFSNPILSLQQITNSFFSCVPLFKYNVYIFSIPSSLSNKSQIQVFLVLLYSNTLGRLNQHEIKAP